MFTDRSAAILRRLEEKGEVKVSELSSLLGCSEVTIRNDIRKLEKKGALRRTHGGAVAKEGAGRREERLQGSWLGKNVEKKQAIAREAYRLIEDGDTIMIDDATTTFYLAEYIREHPGKQIAVVTNSLLSGNELAGLPNVELYIVGGYVGGRTPATMGEEAEKNISGFHVDKAFIGAHGINFQAGMTSIGTPQMRMKQAILRIAKEVYVMADSSKFGGGYLQVVCPVDALTRIITDDQISARHLEEAGKWRDRIIIASLDGKEQNYGA